MAAMDSANTSSQEHDDPDQRGARVVIVGVCASGKTTLADGLVRLGFNARSCAQEHSYVHDFWRLRCRADVLIYLEASLPVIRRRRGQNYYPITIIRERERLAHAHAHSDIVIETDDLTIQQVLDRAVTALRELGFGLAEASVGRRPL